MGLRWIHALFANLLAWFGWLPITLSQLETSEFVEIVSGSVSFFDAVLVSLGHIAILVCTIVRGRLDIELAARDVVSTLRSARLQKVEHLNGFGLTSNSDLSAASVVMLCRQVPTSSMKQFMRYLSSSHHVDSILLQCLPLTAAALTTEICQCLHPCYCVMFWTVETITIQLDEKMPGILKKLSDSLCLLPSLQCLKNGCHGYGMGDLNAGVCALAEQRMIQPESRLACPTVSETLDDLNVGIDELAEQRMIQPESRLASPTVSETLDNFAGLIEERPTCVCIPLQDDWTRLLIRFLKSRDEESRGSRNIAVETLEASLAGTGASTSVQRIEYSTTALILPRLFEMSINAVLTGLFKVDGFSSALTARRAARNYIVDARGNGFRANVFLTEALVHVSATNSSGICQVLTFRHPITSLRVLAFLSGGVNLLCTLWWCFGIGFGKGIGQWSHNYSWPPRQVSFFIIIATMCIGLGIDSFYLYLNKFRWKEVKGFCAVILLEIIVITASGTIFRILGIAAFGRWLYVVLQGMVWVKWGFGCYFLGEFLENHSTWARSGVSVYSCAFFLSAILGALGGIWMEESGPG